ncbi:hypothetical protein CJF31_00005449 [Rutstroemia sp. NJR-2017a BVV2]|nr:hypothetical protein CJF31_00005449 [Rutstroemia sp. NJR-2017a BVV2]
MKHTLTDAASSAIFLLAHRLSPALAPPRQSSSLSLFPYDGNLIGGLLLGIGMALTGACPGTVLPQVVTGIRSGQFALLGGILGGILYSKLKPYIRRHSIQCPQDANPTLYQKLDPKADETKAIYIYQNFCWGVILLASWFSGNNSESVLAPTWGGILIGICQGTSLALTGNTLGTSNAYEQVGDIFWWTLSSGSSTPNTKTVEGNEKPTVSQPTPRPTIKGTSFVLGILLGSFTLSRLVTLPASTDSLDISIPKALLGGLCMVFGARIAGGCTSGHGISGMSLLSVASIISVCAMFGGGIAWGLIVSA